MSQSNPTPRGLPAIPGGPTPNVAIPGVIPIRGITPATPSVAVPLRLPKAPRKRPLPVARRPWRVVLVPPTPGAPTRGFQVARWQARLALSVLGVVVATAIGAVAATMIAVRSPDLFTESADVASLRDRVWSLQDSLARVTATLAGAEAAAAAESAANSPPLVDRLKADRAALSRPLLARRSKAVPSAEVASVEAAGAPSGPGEKLPVAGRIASAFSSGRRHPLLHIIRPHLGVDISAPRGTPIRAPAPGRVAFVGRKFAFGLVVEIEHADGMLTRYAHCQSAVVKVGDQVARGTLIATVGSSGLTTGPHLHYEMLHNGRQVNPLHFHLRQAADSVAAAVVAVPAPAAPRVDSTVTPAGPTPN